jgi:hypothetical protein
MHANQQLNLPSQNKKRKEGGTISDPNFGAMPQPKANTHAHYRTATAHSWPNLKPKRARRGINLISITPPAYI